MRHIAIRRMAALSFALLGGFLCGCSKQSDTAKEKPADSGATTQPAAAATATLTNLQAAFNGESNAHAKYLAFAKKADEEGFGQVASLFRAAARAEAIHADGHAEVIRKLGGDPKADVKTPEVKSTKENLEAALKGESYERDTMYPDFIKKAREEGQKDAIRSMNRALNAEVEHAKLYTQALAAMDSWKAGKKEFYVCPVCGYTVLKIDFEKCPSCFTDKAKFEQVS
jgi:rubrerythrin